MWALVGRDPACLNWERGGEPNAKSEERKVLRKAEIARLLDLPEAVEFMLKFGGMTKSICEDLTRGLYLWQETGAGISLKRAKGGWRKLRKIVVDISIRV